MNKFLVILLSLGLLLFSSSIYAAEAGTCVEYCADTTLDMPAGSVCYCNPLGDNVGLDAIIDPIIGFIFKLSVVVVPVLVIYGAFMIITAAGDVAKVDQAKKIIFWTLVGFTIVLLSRGISDLIEVIIGI